MERKHGSLGLFGNQNKTPNGVCKANSSFAALLIAAIVTLAGCGDGGSDGGSLWLADLRNPFLGQWESNIPSMNNAKMVSDFKTDGTFTCGFPDVAGYEGPFDGGYLVSGNVMVSYLTFEGVAGYTFKVVDNDTIDVTEIEEVKADGTFELGNTSSFTRVAGSPVNKENKPFVLNHPFLGKWHFFMQNMPVPEYGEGTFDIVTDYDVKADGTLAYDFTVSHSGGAVLASEAAETPYFIFDESGGGGGYKLVVYEEGEGFSKGTITPVDNNTIYLT
ncbi:MAG: hypothetical protein LBG72_00100, partial [Spirochaetaceae bacterium]|nr:hypothetical protein [Spirochaetaceae bacterium]